MSAIESFDPAPYVRLPNLDLVSFVALGHQLLTAQPQRPPAGVKASGEQLTQTLTEVEASLSEQFKLPSALDSRTIDQEADVSWGSLNRRLDAYGQLPHDRYPKAVRAQALQKTLFPSGLAFLNLEYGAQWTEAEQRIKLIAKEKLKADIEELAGADFYAELLRCHSAYGELVGATKVKTQKSKLPDLRIQRNKLQQALTTHSIQLVAMVLSGGESALKAAQPSFAAIDAYREKAMASPADKKSPPEPVAPLQGVVEDGGGTPA